MTNFVLRSAALLGLIHTLACTLALCNFSLTALSFNADLLMVLSITSLAFPLALTIVYYILAIPYYREHTLSCGFLNLSLTLWLPCLISLFTTDYDWVQSLCFIICFWGFAAHLIFLQNLTRQSSLDAQPAVQSCTWLGFLIACSLVFFVGPNSIIPFALPTASILFSMGLFTALYMYSSRITLDFSSEQITKPIKQVHITSLSVIINWSLVWLSSAWLATSWPSYEFMLAWLAGFSYAAVGYSTRDYESLSLYGSSPSILLLCIALLFLGYPAVDILPIANATNLLALASIGFAHACILIPSAILFFSYPKSHPAIWLSGYSSAAILLLTSYNIATENTDITWAFFSFFTIAIAYHFTILPHDWFLQTFRFCLVIPLRVLFNLRVVGKENVSDEKEPLVIVSNHVSFLDTPILGSILNEKLIYPIFPWWLEHFYIKLANGIIADIYPTSTTSPANMLTIVKAIKSGRKCLIFPEGRLTNTGNLMKIYEGSTLLIENAQARVQAVITDGGSQTKLARPDYRSACRFFPQLTAAVGPVHTIDYGSLRGKLKRQYVTRQVFGLITDAMLSGKPNETLFDALATAQYQYGSHKLALRHADWSMQSTYKALYQAAWRIHVRLIHLVNHDDIVGIWLGVDIPFSQALFGCFARQSIAMPIEPNIALTSWTNIITTYAPRVIITNQQHLEDPKFSEHRQLLTQYGIKLIAIDNLVKPPSLFARISCQLTSLPQRDPRDIPALLLPVEDKSTTPVFSHYNLHQQTFQLGLVSDLLGRDVVFNQIGLHHIFGLIQGLLQPLLASGVTVVLDNTRSNAARTFEAFYDLQATIMVTSTEFLRSAEKCANSYETLRLRMVYATSLEDSARVDPDLADTWAKDAKSYVFNSLCHPDVGVVSLNHPYYVNYASHGCLLPGMTYKRDANFRDQPPPELSKLSALQGPQMPTWLYQPAEGLSQMSSLPVWYPTNLSIQPLGYIETDNDQS